MNDETFFCSEKESFLQIKCGLVRVLDAKSCLWNWVLKQFVCCYAKKRFFERKTGCVQKAKDKKVVKQSISVFSRDFFGGAIDSVFRIFCERKNRCRAT
ncbi:MAG: hypothetical protein V1777_00455 [Candidatus Micrarchaeota archaeon]